MAPMKDCDKIKRELYKVGQKAGRWAKAIFDANTLDTTFMGYEEAMDLWRQTAGRTDESEVEIYPLITLDDVKLQK